MACDYDTTMNGTIHTTANGLDIYFQDGNYYVTEGGFNTWYLCKWNKRDKLFSFYARKDVQFMEYKEFVDAFNVEFKRVKVNWL